MIEEKTGDLIRTFRGTLIGSQIKMFDKILERYMLALEDSRMGILWIERIKIKRMLKRVEALMQVKASDSVEFYRLLMLQKVLYDRRAELKRGLV